MTTRRAFLKSSAIGVGSFAWAPLFAPTLARAVQDGVPGVVPSVLGGHVRRFVFTRKSNGIRPHEVALPTFTSAQANLDKERKPLGGGLEANTPKKQKAMTDILVAAIATGLTNVVTMGRHHATRAKSNATVFQ